MPSVTKTAPTKPFVKTIKSSIQTSLSDPRFVDFEAMSEDPNLKILLYGQSGTGKTTLWSTFPGPILVLLASGGNSGGELRSLNAEGRKKTKGFAIKSMEDAKDFVEIARRDEWKTVVIDHVTGLADVALKDVIGLDEIPAQKSWGMARQQDYGTANGMVKDVCRSLLGLFKNVIFIAQERVFSPKEDGFDSDLIKPTVGAAASPGVTQWLNSSCDYIANTVILPVMKEVKTTIGKEVKTTRQRGTGVEYALRIGPSDYFKTKFRRPLEEHTRDLPEFIVNPTYDKIVAEING